MTSKKWHTQVIGAAGELLVQYQLLKHEIDSARLTTDSGIDLVMYVPGTYEALTVQVKAMQRPYTEGKRVWLEWGFPLNCKADWLVAVDLSRDMAWLFPIHDALRFATGTAEGLTYLAWYCDATGGRVLGKESDYEHYRLDNVIGKIIADAESPETERDS